MSQFHNWKTLLGGLSYNVSWMSPSDIKQLITGKVCDTPLEYVLSMMQANYPGPYTMDEYFDSDEGLFQYRLVFASAEEETFWMLSQT